ncbi:MAG: FimB/Mfa2 family fimbrial subunit [Rikenellaceae bacterium]|nr:FimB/Mfa2 family fimbrial subunit [Rikenellaceae bacterium]
MSIKSHIKSLWLGLALVAGLVSCTKDAATEYLPVDPNSALVKLSIYTPSSSVPQATRSQADADEGAVSRIKLAVLELSGGIYRYRYMVDGQQIVQSSADSQLTTFSALLTSSDVPLKIVIVANYNDAFESGEIVEDMTESNFKEWLIDSFDSGIEGELPLYGEISLTQLRVDQPNSFSVTMLRAVVRVDVNNTIATGMSEDFRLESVYIYRANDRYNVIPSSSAIQTEGKMSVSSATVPGGASVYPAYHKNVESEGDKSITRSYLPESLPVTDQALQTSTATCVVVGGYYADDTALSYYRIDFDSGFEGHPFGQVLRNHKYIFNIMQVNGRGWPTPGDAAQNEATAITATMQVWNELTSEMWFSGDENYLGISSRKVVLQYFAGAEKTETLQATVPFSVKIMDENGDPTGQVITPDGGVFTTDFYRLEVARDYSSGNDIWKLVFTSTGDNYSASDFTGSLQVYTDWWTFDIEVVQETYQGMMASRYVRVLTITDLDGDLGTTDGTFTDASGAAMRRVLENPSNFSSLGKVTIGGVIVYDLKNATITSQSASDMYILEKVLSDVDVVHLPAECTPSSAAAKLITDWHSSKVNNILIVGFDSDNTNSTIEAYIYDLEDADVGSGSGTWETTSQITALERAEDDWQGRTERFFNGPFGPVAEGIMGLSKLSIGYNNGYNDETTAPLLRVAAGSDVHLMMTHGINITAGVFYCGDSGITSNRGSAMSDTAHTDGIVTSDFDRLMANIWAWIVERTTMISANT